MSTASSPKHNRNERHLQRQRGAGARNLTTSFGFVLGLPLDLPAQPVADPSHAIEPPAKRRKVFRENVKESGHVLDHAQGPAAKEESIRQTQSTFGSRSRRRFNTLPEEKDTLPKLQTDDSFAEARPVVRKRGRPKKACVRDDFTVTDKGAVAPGLASAVAETGGASAPLKKRRGRPRKIVSLSPNNEPAVTRTRDEFAKTTHLPVKKRGRPKKLVATAADNTASDQDSASAESGKPTANHFSLVPPDLQEGQAQQLSKSAATERLAVRPRRQAATSAMSKMLEVFIEEELPVDSKRREVTDESTKKRQRRTAPSANTSNRLKRSVSPCTTRENTVCAPTGLKDSERAWPWTVKDNAAPERKPLSAAEVNALTIEARSSEAPEEACGPKQRRRKQVVLAAGKENDQMQPHTLQQPTAILGAALPKRIDDLSSATATRRSTAREIYHVDAESQGTEPMDHSKFAAISSVTDSTRGTAASDQDISKVSRAGIEPGLDVQGAQVSSEQRGLVSTQNDKAMTADASKEKSSLPGAVSSSTASGTLSSSRREANGKWGLPYKHRSNEQDIDRQNVSHQGRTRTSLRRATKCKPAKCSSGGNE
ncbi:hypothetical protein HII31_05282 [Pseudocercospora fuligena]|uniref:Uncharacterized protein n=1 Tax=Pseudocercospora fuligena TaxID=685502 RepID=A0A8H6VK68_9PEZI|nr:hypothetical protein HII31_05282 [Pseudocercospora fuligena]